MKLSIIIVNYHTGALTKALIESLLREGLPNKSEIIVVDNASPDESVAFLRSDFPEITVIALPKNVGLAAGVNAGIRQASGEYYLILNPDIIALPGAVQTLVDFMDRYEDVGISGGKLLSPNGDVQYSCYRFYRLMTIVYRRTWLGRMKKGKNEIAHFLMQDFDRDKIRDVEWLMGACLMVRAKMVEQIRGMDKRYFLYFEDVDWCRRAWASGWRVTYVPHAEFSHYHQRSSEQSSMFSLWTNRAVQHHIVSAAKYFWKFRGQPLPRVP